ncbi:MAG: hypothetical protein COB08_004215 [Rhodobacteraceae bacterium]|nr:hypothetical protein [Paracoccaceae bacterium]
MANSWVRSLMLNHISGGSRLDWQINRGDLKQNFDVKIFAALESSGNFQFHDGNKKERREIELRWSFSNLIRQLVSTPKEILSFQVSGRWIMDLECRVICFTQI